MPESLDVIALISGGKDSLFSILHCIQNGHRVVALANLYPPADVPPPATARSYDPSSQLCSSETGVPLDGGESSDLNSFMYQTVGHSVIPLYSKVLCLPLYRQAITGTSVQQSQYYDTSPALSSTSTLGHHVELDETEDLVPLLRRIIAAHPHAKAISTGAILSTYQRTRVESVAVRLGLVPLSYLWQYPLLPPPVKSVSSPSRPGHRSDSLTGLLEDIAWAAIDARIIKIASAGVSEKLLFASVADPNTHSRLVAGLAPFFEPSDEIGLRGAVLGEGGEYETIALSGPKSVWKGGHIEIDRNSSDAYTEDGVTYFRFGDFKVVPHDNPVLDSDDGDQEVLANPSNLVSIPAPFDGQFERVRTRLVRDDQDGDKKAQKKSSQKLGYTGDARILNPHPGYHDESTISDKGSTNTLEPLRSSHTVTSSTIAINNVTTSATAAYSSLTPQHSLEDIGWSPHTAVGQMQVILSNLPQLLADIAHAHGLPSLQPSHIVSTTLLLSSMSDFATVNPVYAQIYPVGLPNPPARVTVATILPRDILVSLSLVLDLCSPDRKRGLHVQGRSYWAPANIGPYSQAIAVPLRSDIVCKDGASAVECDDKTDATTTNDDDGNNNNDEDEDGDDDDQPDNNRLEIAHIAGQIPLVASSMELHVGSFLDTALLSLQHLWRIGQERRVDLWPWTVAYLAKDDDTNIRECITTAYTVWKDVHLSPTWSQGSTDQYGINTGDENDDNNDDDDDGDNEANARFDVWDLQHNRFQHGGFRTAQPSVGRHLHVLPDHDLFRRRQNHHHRSQALSRSRQTPRRHIPPFVAAVVTALPRNASIEWWSNGIVGLAKTFLPLSHIEQTTWRRRDFDWGNISCLTIHTNRRQGRQRSESSIRFISCFVGRKRGRTVTKRKQGENMVGAEDSDAGDVPSSIEQIVRLVNGDIDDNTHNDNDNENNDKDNDDSSGRRRSVDQLSHHHHHHHHQEPKTRIQLVRGLAYVSTSSSSSTLSTSSSSTRPVENAGGNGSEGGGGDNSFPTLLKNLTIIPCHSIWGSAMMAIDKESNTDKTKEEAASVAIEDEEEEAEDQVQELELAILLQVNVNITKNAVRHA